MQMEMKRFGLVLPIGQILISPLKDLIEFPMIVFLETLQVDIM